MRILAAIAITALAFSLPAFAQTYTEHTAANGVKYITPDNWTPITFGQASHLAKITPGYAETLENDVPGVEQMYREQERIFYLNWLDERQNQLATLSFSIFPVPREEWFSQSEFQDLTPLETDELLVSLSEQGSYMAAASLRAGADIYNSITFVEAGLVEYGSWHCIAFLFETEGKAGHDPYYMPISCPAGSVSLQFNLYVERDLLADVSVLMEDIVSGVDVSAIAAGRVR